ncbi:MAG: DEAD/DEAH box helicase [Actinomycetales bacterium]|nr:DEAD/DEAH box helicase [Actinomycetales bacterium]
MSSSPAERYAAAKARANLQKSLFGGFCDSLKFELDEFQRLGCLAIQDGHGVLVAAPTSAGKTIVGQFAAYLALANQSRCFYTTPIKALSNQKYHEFVATFGAEHVGLLTGDNSINGDAQIVVMTTEVLRNMLYENQTELSTLSHVVMDEVHYLADRTRGAVWEEVIIHLPEFVRVVALSATVSNAEEFGDWMRTVRGDTEIIVEETRPTPLHQSVMVGGTLYELFESGGSGRINSELLRIARNERTSPKTRGNRFTSRYTPSRITVIENLQQADLLPSINFIFSRAGCEEASAQCLNSGLSLTTHAESLEIQSIIDQRFAEFSLDELRSLNFQAWSESLSRGIAAHHAGLLPKFKEVVEELFQAGLIKLVFATETLALGINMPARSVVLEKLTKWNGSTHSPITPGEYTQLTGRAGRRGIDFEGHAITVWHTELDPQALGGLASTRTYPLKSSFRPSYNMAVNLIDKYGTEKSRELLESSFAQFQADRAVVGIASELRKATVASSQYEEAAECHLGDISEYLALRNRLSELEKGTKRDEVRRRRFANIEFLNSLKRGDVFLMSSGRRTGVLHTVLDPAQDADDPRPRVMSFNKQVKRIGFFDMEESAEVVGNIRITPTFDSRSSKSRHWLSLEMQKLGKVTTSKGAKTSSPDHDAEVEIDRLRKAIRSHPCHGCTDREEHVRWSQRNRDAQKDIKKLEDRISARTSSIAKEFDRICSVLTRLEYLTEEGDGHQVTDRGRLLRGIYSDRDLLVTECIEQGVWQDLSAEQLASAASALVYDARRDDENPIQLPEGSLGDALIDMQQLWGELKDVESQCRVDYLAELDFGFIWPTLKWARGQELSKVLRNQSLAPGDFVRWTKQVIDLLRQISVAADDRQLAQLTKQCADSLERGIVAW